MVATVAPVRHNHKSVLHRLRHHRLNHPPGGSPHGATMSYTFVIYTDYDGSIKSGSVPRKRARR